MTKDEYIESNLNKLFYYWLNILLISGAVFILLLGFLDYFSSPSNFRTFFVYRIITAAVILIICFVNRIKVSRILQNSAIILSGLVVSTMVALMISKFGGHESPYFAGMVLTIVYILGFVPVDVKTSTVTALIIYGNYILPILFYDNISNSSYFFAANGFILAITFIVLLTRYLNQQRFLSEFGLRYEIENQKKQLEDYSTQLEGLVAERTKALAISEERYKGLFDNANDGIAVLDKNGTILNVNRMFSELHGFEKEALIGSHYKLLEVQDARGERDKRIAELLKGEPLVYEAEHYRKDGTRILLEISSKAIEIGGEVFIQSFHRDITEKKRLQGQLFQSQKMESVGLLAGGIAHDFNNMLAAILGHAELLHDFSDLNEPERKKVQIIEKSARKMGQMVSRLLSFSRKGSFEVVPLSLNDVIKDTLQLLERTLVKKEVQVILDLDPDLPIIQGDGNQLEQVLMNLIMNSVDALPDGGKITISDSLANLGNRAYLVHPLLSPGNYLRMTVSDEGSGIPAEIRDKIFDPFFTSKEPGKGTGLGLAMVYGIVKEHRGAINVKSHVGRGTTFEIYLPAFEVIKEESIAAPEQGLKGRGKILVIDDEKDILSYTKEVLEARGFNVLTTDNPAYALDVFRKIYDGIDLVITDIVMPLINGRELIQKFREIKPDVKIIAISGYDSISTTSDKNSIDAFINKPFESIYLLSTIGKVLYSPKSQY